MTTEARIPLPRLSRYIAERSGGRAPSYRQLYAAAVDGTIPAEQRINGRYDVGESDVPAIAAEYGIALRDAPAAAA